MKTLGFAIGLFALTAVAHAQETTIPVGWRLIENTTPDKHGTSFMRITPIQLPPGYTAEVILAETKNTSAQRGNAITALGKPIQVDYRSAGFSRTFQVSSTVGEKDRQLIYTGSNPEVFQRLLPDVSRLADQWVIGPASNRTSDSKTWGSGNTWSSAGGSASGDRTNVTLNGGASGGTSGGGNVGGRVSGGGNAGGSVSGGGSASGSASASSSSSSSSKNSQSNSSSQRNSDSDSMLNSQRNESIVYDPGTRQFQLVNGGLAITKAKLDGDYLYRSDRFGGALQADMHALDMVFTIKGNAFTISRLGRDGVLAEGTFTINNGQIALQYTRGRTESYGFLVLSEMNGFVEKLAIGGTVLSRKH